MANSTKKLSLTAIMAALCYVAFTFLQIKIPTPVGYTSFHLGNVFCVLAALLMDGPCGGIAGAIGMGIGDLLDPVYVITVPKTILLKYFIGYITGSLAHNVLKIEEKQGKDLTKAVVYSITGGMAFNIVGEPIVSYFYYDVILSNAQKALSYLNITKWITTSVNSILTIIVSSLLYFGVIKRIKIKK